jgi:hypothetical protein
VKPDEYAAPPTTVPKTPAVAAAHDLLYCEQILAGRPPRPSGAEPFRPSPPRSLARNRRRLQLPSSCRIGDTLAPANLCGAVEVPKPVFHLRPMASMPLTAAAPAANPFRDPALPSALRHFQEAVVPRVAYLKRPGGETPAAAAAATDRRGLPGWAITIGTALGVLLVALFAVQRFTARADVHAASAPGAVATTPAAYGAWPSIDKYVEVAGVRITTDQKQNSEAVFSVVNHSSADIGAMAIKLTVPSAKAGDPPVCDMTANVEGLGPWEAREVRVQLTREVQASEMPEWRDMRPRVSITSPQ